jgi:hypothetical protein
MSHVCASGGTSAVSDAGPSPSDVAATLLEPALLDQAGYWLTDPHGPPVRTAGKPIRTAEEMT